MPIPYRRFRRWLLAATLCAGALDAATAASDDDSVRHYHALQSALDTDRPREASQHLDALADSPLAPYARLTAIRARLETVAPERVTAFLADHPRLPAADALRVAWLRELARREDWPRLLALYDGERDVHVRCAVVRGRLSVGRERAAVDLALELWDVGYRQPQGCVPAFDLLARRGELTPARVLRRMQLALLAGNPGLASAYLDRLPAAERRLAARWIAVFRDPLTAAELEASALGSREQADTVLKAAFRHYARRAPGDARAAWTRVRERHAGTAAAPIIERRIALEAVYDGLPAGLDWLMDVADAHATATVHAWRVRAALRAGDWAAVAEATARMPEDQRAEPRWQYWRARALQRGGRGETARTLLAAAAKEFSYYGFLAADATGRPYHWGAAIADSDPARQSALREREALRLAFVLDRAGEHRWAADEWRGFIRGLERRDRLAAARVASAKDWPWAAQYASALAGVDNASFLRFPAGYRTAVERSAETSGVGAPWLLALIRQESAFRQTSCSNAGACGLMQLMPATARWMLERMGRPVDDIPGTLADPERNVPAGAAYLAYLMDRFDDPVLALTAYNAGPGNVADWLEREGPPPASARWLETLPFGETREYVKAVLFNQVIYHLRLDGRTDRLAALLREDRPTAAATRLARTDQTGE